MWFFRKCETFKTLTANKQLICGAIMLYFCLMMLQLTICLSRVTDKFFGFRKVYTSLKGHLDKYLEFLPIFLPELIKKIVLQFIRNFFSTIDSDKKAIHSLGYYSMTSLTQSNRLMLWKIRQPVCLFRNLSRLVLNCPLIVKDHIY